MMQFSSDESIAAIGHNALGAAHEEGAPIYLHCSAGIHRTGMIDYAFLRYLNISELAAIESIAQMRNLTQEGGGLERLAWGNTNFGHSPNEERMAG